MGLFRMRMAVFRNREIALVLPANFPYMGSATDTPCHFGEACRTDLFNECSQSDDHRWRTAIRQDPSRRELSGGVMDHPSAPPGADSCFLQFCSDRRRYRRSCLARRADEAQIAR